MHGRDGGSAPPARLAHTSSCSGRLLDPQPARNSNKGCAIDGRALSIDVLLVREGRREMVVAEVWDWPSDVGEAFRGHATKTAAVEASNPNWMVGGLFVLRGTRRNRELVHELRDLFAARFPIPSAAVLALADADRPLPAGSALVWTDAAATRLLLSRLS